MSTCKPLNVITYSAFFLYCSSTFAVITPDQFEDVSLIPQRQHEDPILQQFDKVSPRGIGYPLESWGLAWGDLNGDGYPDLWAGNHRKHASLYRNNRDGTFTDLMLENKNEVQDGTGTSEIPIDSSDYILDYFRPKNPIAMDKNSNAADSHGPAWADFDSDGDMDLFETTGGRKDNESSNNYLFRNIGNGKLRNISNAAHFSPLKYGYQAGRSALWLDFNDDTRLDLFLSGTKNFNDDVTLQGKLFRQNADGSFAEIANNRGIKCSKDFEFAALADLNGDEFLDLICHHQKFPQKVYDMQTLQSGRFTDITEEIFESLEARPEQVKDVMIADFDGDLKNEIIAVRTDGNRSGAVNIDPNTVYARLSAERSDAAHKITLQGLDVTATGNLNIDFTTGHLGGKIKLSNIPGETTANLFFGAAAACIPIQPGLIEFKAVLDRNNPSNNNFPMQPGRCGNAAANNVDVTGLPDINAESHDGMYIGYQDGAWKIRIKNDHTGLVESVWMVLKGDNNGTPVPLSKLRTIPADLDSKKYALSYYDQNNDHKYVNKANKMDIEDNRAIVGDIVDPVSCTSITAGDFDNDMDLDLYLVCENIPLNAENIMFENDGNGKFHKVENSAGAISTTLGIGKTVAMSDYDVDGFLDLYVTNGHSGGSIPNGPDQLFRNRGNNNHWIELDLVGSHSNIHGIGARVELKTADGKTQVREMNGGAHNYVQDHQRIHFGLGDNTSLKRLRIHWPASQQGVYSTYNVKNLAVDKLYNVFENDRKLREVALEKPEHLKIEDDCGPSYHDKAVNRGLFLWKICGDETWRLRASPGGGSTVVYAGSVSSDLAISTVAPVDLEADDIVDVTTDTDQINFIFNVMNTNQDGVDFHLGDSNQACLELTGPERVQVLFGRHQKSVDLPLDLVTLQRCNPRSRPGDECGAPDFDPELEQGLFIWKNCRTGQWTIRATPGKSTMSLAYRGIITSDDDISKIIKLGIEPNDVIAGEGTPRIDYTMNVVNANHDGFRFNINGTGACIDNPRLPVNSIIELGQNRTPITLPFNTSTLGPCRHYN